MMATDRHTEDINEFLSSLGHCFEEADKALIDECNSVPMDYTESRLEDHLQIVNAIAIAIQDYGGDELKQLIANLQTFSESLLYEIYTTKVQREASSVKSAAGFFCRRVQTGISIFPCHTFLGYNISTVVQINFIFLSAVPS